MGHRILIADDERDLVATCVRLLASRHHACLAAYTGQQAIELITREQPSLVVTDLYLPDVSGLTVLRHARQQAPPIPVILMTAYQSPAVTSAAEGAGAAFTLTKPFSNVALLEGIDRVLERR